MVESVRCAEATRAEARGETLSGLRWQNMQTETTKLSRRIGGERLEYRQPV
jgi:hypothetical protein